jgi:hypothetical protein
MTKAGWDQFVPVTLTIEIGIWKKVRKQGWAQFA